MITMFGNKNRKTGVIYANKDEKGNTLTYSVLHKTSEGSIVEFEKNNRRELECFCDKRLKRKGLN